MKYVALFIVILIVLHSFLGVAQKDDLVGCFTCGEGIIIADIEGAPATAALTMFDYDNDNDMDFVAGIQDAGMDPQEGIFMFVNDRGTYKPRYLFKEQEVIGDVLISADFNEDGYTDFISGGTQGTVRLFINQPTFLGYPRFENEVLAQFGQTAWGLTTGDFNNDDHIDFAVASADGPFTHATITIFYNDGNGDFSNRNDVFNYSEHYIHSLDAGDYDLDGDLDFIFTYSETSGSTYVYGITCLLVNDGTGNYSESRVIAKRGSGITNDPENRINPCITSADYDEDGDLDLFIGDNSGKIEYLMNNGTGNFTTLGILHDFGSISWGLASGDFNNDGDIDLMVAAKEQGSIGHIYLKHNIIDPVRICKPLRNYLHFADRTLRINFQNTIVVGKINIEVEDQMNFTSVEFSINDELLFVDTEKPFDFLWDERTFGLREISIVAYDASDNEYSDEITVVKLF